MWRLLVVGFIVVGLMGYFMMQRTDQLAQQTLKVGGQSVVVDLASTPSEQQQGLSGRQELDEGMGMLFTFAEPAIQTFWMKDMLFDIDIVWIVEHRIIGIESDVVADDGLRRYSSPIPVDMVLELPAGWSERHRLKIGDEIR